ncbi:hypothetical protein [Streptomyces hokutonensis]
MKITAERTPARYPLHIALDVELLTFIRRPCGNGCPQSVVR